MVCAIMKFNINNGSGSNNNKQQQQQQLIVPLLTSVGSAAALYSLYRFYNAQRAKQQRQTQQHKLLHAIISKPLNDDSRSTAVSYIHLKVADLIKSKQFYLDFGLVVVVDDSDASESSESSSSCTSSTGDMILLQVPLASSSSSSQQQQPYLLLQQDTQRIPRRDQTADAAATAVGYARMCLLVQDCQQEMQRLAGKKYQPIAPPVTDRPGNKDCNKKKNWAPLVTIVAYYDPDGNMVELVSFTSGIQAFAFQALKWLGVMKFPYWVHVNINATNYETSWKAYQALGMVMDTNYGMVDNTLCQALGIPAPGAIAKQVSLVKFPKQPHFLVDLIEWQNPKTQQTLVPRQTEVAGSSSHSTCSMRIAIAVDDVALKLDRLLAAAPPPTTPLSDEPSSSLWTLESTPACVDLPPPLHRAIQCTISDPDGVLVDLVSFPQKSVLLPENVDYMRISKSAALDNKANCNKRKAILVTGCDSGFGRSLVVQMAGLGFQVIAACFTQSGADFLESIAALTVVADLTTEKGLKDVVDAVHSIVGDKDIEHGHANNTEAAATGGAELWAIVNNAGMSWPGHVEWTSPQAYKRVMDLNFHAPVFLIHELLSLLRQSKGRIVNVTSVCGIVSSPSNSTYCSSKFALEALSDALRVENKPFGVNVTVVEPMTMDTPLAMNWIKEWDKHYKNAEPNKKSVYPEKWAEGYVQSGGAILKAVAEDPRITVGEIVNALVMKDPPARILSGVGARGYYHLSRLGESERDALFHIGPEPKEADFEETLRDGMTNFKKKADD